MSEPSVNLLCDRRLQDLDHDSFENLSIQVVMTRESCGGFEEVISDNRYLWGEYRSRC